MCHKIVALSIFAVLLAVASCRPQGDVFDCSDRENGPYADPLDSNAFYVCLNGELIVRSKCDAEETFDADLKACTGGAEDEDLTTYSDIKSDVSELLPESLLQYVEPYPQRPPPPPPPPPSKPTPWYKNKIVNIQVTDNIFPKSIIVIGRANREQKNK